jgi:hypothetical protein
VLARMGRTTRSTSLRKLYPARDYLRHLRGLRRTKMYSGTLEIVILL